MMRSGYNAEFYLREYVDSNLIGIQTIVHCITSRVKAQYGVISKGISC